MTAPYKLIIFDLDGTLLDTLEDLAAAVNHALSIRGLPLHSLQEYRSMVGHGVRNLVQQALQKSMAGAPPTAGSPVLPPTAGSPNQPLTAGSPNLPPTAVSPDLPPTTESPNLPPTAGNPHLPLTAGSQHLPPTAAFPRQGIAPVCSVPDNAPVSPGPDSTPASSVPDNTPVPPGPDDALIDAALADFKAFYTAHIDVHTRPYPGMPELLKDLHAAGIQMAVASNKFQTGTEKRVREFFPGIPFVAILGNREGFPLKPSPEIVEEVLSATASGDSQLPRAKTVMVGDSRTDMLTAANGGISAIAVTWGYRTLEPSPQFRLAPSVSSLRTLLFGRPFYVGEPVSTPPEAPSTPLQKLVYETFQRLQIAFTRVDTDPGITMEDCANISRRLNVDIVKTVFLCNRQQTTFYLYVMPAGKPFVTRDFCAALGIPRVSFASPEKLLELTGVEPGATTILSAVLPSASEIHLVMDRTVAEAPDFACTDGTPTCFVRLCTRTLLEKYLDGREITLI